MQRTLMLTALIASLLSACSTLPNLPGTQAAAELDASQWHLTTVSNPALQIPPSPSIELRFLDGRLHFHGCNALSGRYTQDNNTLQVAKGLIGTRMKCNDELMAIDAAATRLLEQGVSYRTDGDLLTLTHQKERWTFRRAQ